MSKPVTRLYIAYDAVDEYLALELERHLAPMSKKNRCEIEMPRRIKAGSIRNIEEQKYINNSDIVILLISSNFLASEYGKYFANLEAKFRREGRPLRIPVLVRDCDWESSDFSHLMHLPKKARPVASHESRDEAWVSVVSGISETLEALIPSMTEQLRPEADAAIVAPDEPQPIASISIVNKYFIHVNAYQGCDLISELDRRCRENVRAESLIVFIERYFPGLQSREMTGNHRKIDCKLGHMKNGYKLTLDAYPQIDGSWAPVDLVLLNDHACSEVAHYHHDPRDTKDCYEVVLSRRDDKPLLSLRTKFAQFDIFLD